jgi:hypothetical protein
LGRFLGRDLDPVRPEFEARVLHTRPSPSFENVYVLVENLLSLSIPKSHKNKFRHLFYKAVKFIFFVE